MSINLKAYLNALTRSGFGFKQNPNPQLSADQPQEQSIIMSRSSQQKHSALSFKLFQPGVKRQYTTKPKKQAPPRPPPPKINSGLSKSKSLSFHQRNDVCLIDFSSLPQSPLTSAGSDGLSLQSFSSASSSNQSTEEAFDPFGPIIEPTKNSSMQPKPKAPTDPFESIALRKQNGNSTFYSIPVATTTKSMARTTIIRPKKSVKPNDPAPVKSIEKAPFQPVDMVDSKWGDTPHAKVLYDLEASQPGDLSLKVGQIIQLLYRVNKDWIFGRCAQREGLFPQTFVKIIVPLADVDSGAQLHLPTTVAIFDFNSQVQGDLSFKEGDVISVLGLVNDEWLVGELNGVQGLFPANFVDTVPPNLPIVDRS